MRSIHEQDCPLCSAPAKYKLIDYEERKHFFCKTCIEFVISLQAEKCLANSTLQCKAQYSERAKRSDSESIYHIMMKPQEDNAIQGKLVPRSTLRL